MSKNKNQLQTPPPVESVGIPNTHHQTLGKAAVEAHSLATEHDFKVARSDDINDKLTDLLASKQNPNGLGFVRRTAGRLRGKVMSGTEYRFYANNVHHLKTDGNQADNFERDARAFQAEKADKELEKVRGALVKLGPDEAQNLNRYINGSDPKFLRAIKDQERPKALWSDWLAVDATDEQLLNFLQWHNAELEKQQISPEAQQTIEAERRDYSDAVKNGVIEGYLDDTALVAADKVKNVKVFLGDQFSTYLKDRTGYHRRGTDEVVIAASPYGIDHPYLGKSMLLPNIKKTAFHEFNHAVLGRLGDRWLDEALTEHIAQSLKYGQWEVLPPGLRVEEDSGAYTAERRLLDVLLEHGVGQDGHGADKIPVALATRAYSAYGQGGHESINEFYAAVDAAWAACKPNELIDTLDYINAHVSELEEKYKKDHNLREAQEMALNETASDLLQQPHVVFSPDLKPASELISS